MLCNVTIYTKTRNCARHRCLVVVLVVVFVQMAAAVSANGSANPDFMGFQQVTKKQIGRVDDF